jgi:hypothetical protein
MPFAIVGCFNTHPLAAQRSSTLRTATAVVGDTARDRRNLRVVA